MATAAAVSVHLVLLSVCALVTLTVATHHDPIDRLADRSDASDDETLDDDELYNENHQLSLVAARWGFMTDDDDDGHVEQINEQPVAMAAPVSLSRGSSDSRSERRPADRYSPFTVGRRTPAKLRRLGSTAGRSSDDVITSGLRERSAVVHGPKNRRGSGVKGEVSMSQLVQLLNSFQTGRTANDADGLPPLQSLRFG